MQKPIDILPTFDFDDSVNVGEDIWSGWMYPTMAAVWFYGHYYGHPNLCERVESLTRYDVHPMQYDHSKGPEDWGPLAANFFHQLVYCNQNSGVL